MIQFLDFNWRCSFYSAFTWARDSATLYQSPSSLSTQPDRYHLKLTNGALVYIGSDGKSITSSITKLRDLLPSEITPNYDLASGFQKINSQLRQFEFLFRMNTNLYSSHSGEVIFSGIRTGYGKMIVIQNQDPDCGQATLYAHLNDIIIFEKGDFIGSERTL